MLDLAIVIGVLAAALVLGSREARAGGLSDYVLAGRRLTLPMFVATLVPSFYGGVLGVGEFTWANGLSNWVVMALPYYVFAALYAAFLAGRVRLEPGLTLPDHIEGAYGRRAAVWAAFLVFWLASPADELLMTGTLLSFLTGLRLALAMALCAAFAAALLLRGGLRSDVGANRVQFIAMFAGFALILPFAWSKIGGLAELKLMLPAAHLSWTGGMSAWKIAGWWLIAVWTLVDPSFHQRCAAAQDPRTARLGILVCILFWGVFDFMTTAAGLYARAALPQLSNPVMAFPALADGLLPPVARGFFFAGMACSMLASLQSKCLLSALSLGKDGLGRWTGAAEERQEFLTRAALFASTAVAMGLALLIPSVVGLWWAVGSVLIPGLLLPLLGVYFPRLRAKPAWALTASVCGVLSSGAWLIWERRLGAAPLGIEPMFPGLLLSGALWALPRAFP
ncbi:MAG: hypothetical protein HY077_17595 [Elusimicrobia bacterium]|nr:hypothetical protein [Elusimicrobiota bacterium]